MSKLKTKVKLGCSIAALLIAGACSTAEQTVKPAEKKSTEKQSPLAEIFDTSAVFSGNFTGFALYDPDADSMIFAQNEDKYFTPASNTKLFAFYTGLKLLPDSLPSLEYIVSGDSLIFWGTGYPALLHPDFDDNNKLFNFLKNSPENLYFSDSNFKDEVLGPGWAWGDYQYYYSTERSPFPIYGNVVRFEIEEIEVVRIKPTESGLSVIPKAFQSRIEEVDEKDASFIYRPFFDNQFEYKAYEDTVTYTTDRPFHYTPELFTELLADTLGRPVEYINRAKPEHTERLYGLQVDTLYKRMLQPSDNFLAEQILFMSASELGFPLNAATTISYMKVHHLDDLPDEPEWVDGSGLSRYNMFTPRSIIKLLEKIDDEFIDDEKLFDMLPNGGKSGTIRNWYGARDSETPYVFAKTGTLNHNHTLSGYLKTRSGKKLLFSFMNNHYTSSTNVVRREMEKVLWFIHENY